MKTRSSTRRELSRQEEQGALNQKLLEHTEKNSEPTNSKKRKREFQNSNNSKERRTTRDDINEDTSVKNNNSSDESTQTSSIELTATQLKEVYNNYVKNTKSHSEDQEENAKLLEDYFQACRYYAVQIRGKNKKSKNNSDSTLIRILSIHSGDKFVTEASKYEFRLSAYESYGHPCRLYKYGDLDIVDGNGIPYKGYAEVQPDLKRKQWIAVLKSSPCEWTTILAQYFFNKKQNQNDDILKALLRKCIESVIKAKNNNVFNVKKLSIEKMLTNKFKDECVLHAIPYVVLSNKVRFGEGDSEIVYGYDNNNYCSNNDAKDAYDNSGYSQTEHVDSYSHNNNTVIYGHKSDSSESKDNFYDDSNNDNDNFSDSGNSKDNCYDNSRNDSNESLKIDGSSNDNDNFSDSSENKDNFYDDSNKCSNIKKECKYGLGLFGNNYHGIYGKDNYQFDEFYEEVYQESMEPSEDNLTNGDDVINTYLSNQR